MTKLRITPDGRIRGLWSDDIQLGKLGVLSVRRASHVEFDGECQHWTVSLAQAPGRVLFRSSNRNDALAWEHQHFGPGGPGWSTDGAVMSS
jgi:hypothetical protein